MSTNAQRTDLIIGSLTDAFEDLMKANPDAFRHKFRKMARDPFAFYRGSACLFYADVTRRRQDHFSDERTSRVWIHGDLHAENFGTYMNSHGELVFDVNDFDEAYLGHFTWDLRRFAASMALMCWQKALPDADIERCIAAYLRAYLDQVQHYVESAADDDFALRLDNTDGAILATLRASRLSSRGALLDSMTDLDGDLRRFSQDATTRRLDAVERARIEKAYRAYLGTIPQAKKERRTVYYDIKDVVGKAGFGIGSAGLPAYNILIEGFDQALENDIVLSMKQANVPALSRFVKDDKIASYFAHEGERTVASQRALQTHTDAFLGYTEVDGVGFVISEVSPFESDLDWSDISEPDEIEPLMAPLGQATAKIHCASDEDSEQDLVDFSTEAAIAEVVAGREEEFVDRIVEFAMSYAEQVRKDHELFVNAFRGGRFDAVSAL